jgi:hypothetical protein
VPSIVIGALTTKPRLPTSFRSAAESRVILSSSLCLTHVIFAAITNTENWVEWSRHFGLPSRLSPQIKDARHRYVLTAFAYGCGLGPTQAARSSQWSRIGGSTRLRRSAPEAGHASRAAARVVAT